MIDYNTFLANVQVSHMLLLASFTAGERVRVQNTDEQLINDTRAAAQQLYDAGLLSRVAEGYELVNGTETWRTFDGYVVPAALGYCWQLARERLALSRDPLPPA